jgi:alkylation response protein AidB-like acyl-CoA dehydrogenase
VNEELAILRTHARKWATDVAARTTPAERARDGRSLWPQTAELGWSAVAIDEAHGGAGLGMSGAAALLHELGRELIASPLLPTAVVAATALAEGGSAMLKTEWLPKIAAGDVLVAVALENPDGAVPASTPDGNGWRLNGEARFVAGGGSSNLFLISAEAGDRGAGLYLVPAAQVSVQTLDMVDGRDRAHVRLEDVRLDAGARLGVDPAYLLYIAQVAQAAEMVGMAERALEITLDYLRTREQFGQSIGAFQALQHRAAQAYIDLELARACLGAAVRAVEARDDELPALAALVKTQANETLHRIVLEMVQMHGGIGMTAEHVAGHYLKAARVAEASFGSGQRLLAQYARHSNF